MKVIIDTNSLLSLVRYYLPFDKHKILYNFIKDKIQSGEIIIIDKVHEQCSYISKGIILSKLDFLEDIIVQEAGKEIEYKNEENYIERIWKTSSGFTISLENMKNFIIQM